MKPPDVFWHQAIENFAPAVVFVKVTPVTLAVRQAGSKRTGDLTETSARLKVGVVEKAAAMAVEVVKLEDAVPLPPVTVFHAPAAEQKVSAPVSVDSQI